MEEGAGGLGRDSDLSPRIPSNSSNKLILKVGQVKERTEPTRDDKRGVFFSLDSKFERERGAEKEG